MSVYEKIAAKLKLAKQELEIVSNGSLLFAEKNSTHTELLIQTWLDKRNVTCENHPTVGKGVLITLYLLIILVSLFGNTIVCKIVFGRLAAKSTTNLLIGNLSISDLMMTVINIPLMLSSLLLQNWPFGIFFCKCMPFFQALSVNVSTLTMALIAYDRYQVIAYPLKFRPQPSSTLSKMMIIWITAAILSSPYPIMSKLVQGVSCARYVRCQLVYPKPRLEYRKLFSLLTLVYQFLLPLTFCAVIYSKLSHIIWKRRAIGFVTRNQREHLQKDKWKTIRMFIFVLLVLFLCWLPLNVYHTYQDMRGEVGYRKHNSIIWLACHWWAMSSVCYNPFIYCWLNETFRKSVLANFRWICKPLETSPTYDSSLQTHIKNTSILSKA